MNKELEALDNVKDYVIYKAQSYEQTLEDLETIKSALECNEKLEKFVEVLKKDTIINDLSYIIRFDTYKQYVEDYNAENWNIVLNKTEFNLLKEMLGKKTK